MRRLLTRPWSRLDADTPSACRRVTEIRSTLTLAGVAGREDGSTGRLGEESRLFRRGHACWSESRRGNVELSLGPIRTSALATGNSSRQQEDLSIRGWKFDQVNGLRPALPSIDSRTSRWQHCDGREEVRKDYAPFGGYLLIHGLSWGGPWNVKNTEAGTPPTFNAPATNLPGADTKKPTVRLGVCLDIDGRGFDPCCALLDS